MIVAPPRHDEAASLAALHGLGILDTEAEPQFDALVNAAATVCGVAISAISLIDCRRQWFKAVRGLSGVRETPRELAFCAHTVLGEDLLEVPDARMDERFFDHPMVVGAPNIRFYAGMPLRIDGGPSLGTLCVIDCQPRSLDGGQRDLLRQLAQAASGLLQVRSALRQLQQANEALAASRDELRLVIDAVPSMLTYWNPDLTCRFANRACATWMGVDPPPPSESTSAPCSAPIARRWSNPCSKLRCKAARRPSSTPLRRRAAACGTVWRTTCPMPLVACFAVCWSR